MSRPAVTGMIILSVAGVSAGTVAFHVIQGVVENSVEDSLDSMEQLHLTWHQRWQDLADAPDPEPEPCFDRGLHFRGEVCPHPDHRIMSASSVVKGVAFFCVCPRQDTSLYPSIPNLSLTPE